MAYGQHKSSIPVLSPAVLKANVMTLAVLSSENRCIYILGEGICSKVGAQEGGGGGGVTETVTHVVNR